MNEQQKQLIDFVERAAGLDDAAKLRLILVAAGVKPATFVALKITPQNLDEKAHFEKHLRASGFVFEAGKPRAYEQIAAVKGNAIQWRINGSWYGYDVFADRDRQRLFRQYVSLVRRQRHADADRVAGQLYDYPQCCTEQYASEHDPDVLRRHYTHYSYYARLHEVERAFPFVQHTACSKRCAFSRKMNELYGRAVQIVAPKFLKRFSEARTYRTDVVIDNESEVGEDVFPGRDGHEYTAVTLKPIAGHYYLLAHLTKKSFARGTVVPATVRMRYNYADVSLGRPKRIIKNLHHERHFVLP